MLSVVYDASVSDLLKGRLAVILGVANKWSIAYAIANAFSREGAELALTYLSDREKKQVEGFAADWNVAAMFQCDVTKDEDLIALHDNVKALNRPVHTVMHSLAFAKHEELGNPFVETSRDGFLLAQNVSAYSLVAVARSLVPVMAPGGSIITLTYIGSTRVVPNYNVMGVAKASLEATTRYLASDLGPQGIRVNAISAGPIKTVSARGVKDFSTILEVMQQRAPLRRNTDPNEVADAAVFLASDLARGVTGNLLFVDCGMSVMG
jgi:enoyl-[acyl-carrier protein] reductase I